jgi:hypothetical protein
MTMHFQDTSAARLLRGASVFAALSLLPSFAAASGSGQIEERRQERKMEELSQAMRVEMADKGLEPVTLDPPSKKEGCINADYFRADFTAVQKSDGAKAEGFACSVPASEKYLPYTYLVYKVK